MPVADFDFLYFTGNLDDTSTPEEQKKAGWVREQLGFPFVSVELTDSVIHSKVEEALEVYSSIFTVEVRKTLTVPDGVKVFHLDEVGDGVIRVQVENPTFFNDDFLDVPIPLEYRFPSDHLNIADVVLSNGYNGMAKRYLDAEFTWSYEHETKTLIIDDFPSDSNSLVYYYEGYAQSPSDVKVTHRQWFRDFVLAMCDLIVQRIRGKYSVSSPAATMVEYRSEAQQIVEEYKNRLLMLRPDVPPMIG